MKELKFQFVEKKEKNGKVVELYKVGVYCVKVITHEDGSISVGAFENPLSHAEYLPEIYCRKDLYGNIEGFEIQTTSYGSIPAEETRSLISCLEEAVIVAEILTEKFVSKNRKKQ